MPVLKKILVISFLFLATLFLIARVILSADLRVQDDGRPAGKCGTTGPGQLPDEDNGIAAANSALLITDAANDVIELHD